MLAQIQANQWLYIAEPPRCGTSSMRWACNHTPGFQRIGEIHPRRHAFAYEAKPILDAMTNAEITTAICVRNPYARAWSLKKWWWGAHNQKPLALEAMLSETLAIDDSWRRLLRPQATYARLASGETITTHTLRLEHIDSDLASLGKRIAIDFAKVPHHNAFLDRKRMPVLDRQDMQFVAEYYAADFELGGYDPEAIPEYRPTTSQKTVNPYAGL